MRVIATEKGYDNVALREAGEEFDFDWPVNKPLPRWMKKVEVKPAPVVDASKAEAPKADKPKGKTAKDLA